MIHSIALKNFMAFEDIKLEFSPKINVIIGENGMGKSQLLKAIYSTYHSPFTRLDVPPVTSSNKAMQTDQLNAGLTDDLVDLFLPLDRKLGKLHHKGAKEQAEVSAMINNELFNYNFYNNSQNIALKSNTIHSLNTVTFIPTKEVLSFMEGFISVYSKYQLSFDRTYSDLCLALDLPLLRQEKLHEKSKWAIEKLEEIYSGKFVFHGGGKVTFKTKDDELSANAVAEGFRKLGSLARLLENGVINPGQSGPLIWDEPEANLNPNLMEKLVEILLELSRQGQQIILATHDYVLLKWFDLLVDSEKADHILFHTLYRNEGDKLSIRSTPNYKELNPNPIDEAFGYIVDKEIENEMGGLGK